MMRKQASRCAILLTVALVVACAEDRTRFDGQGAFYPDASAPVADAAECLLQCSLDRRSVIQSCTGETVETCSPELACGGGVCQEPCAAAAADRSSNGCDFYFQAPRFTKIAPQSCYAAFIVNTSDAPATVSFELEGKALDLSKAMYRTNPGDATLIPQTGPLAPGESAILFVSERDPDEPAPSFEIGYVGCPKGVVPATYRDPVPGGTGIGTSFHLTTNVPVGLSAIYPFGGAASYLPAATLLLPVKTWAKEHVVINGWEVGRSGGPGAQIVAAEDDTEITIFPTRDIQNGIDVLGTPARVKATYRLDKGQHLQLVQADELTGSVVSSTKPTTIFGGHACADIPSNGAACDTLVQELPAFEQWGSEYVGVGYRPRLGNEHEPMPYRIVAARDGTRLDYDPAVPPGAPLTLNAGEAATFKTGTGDAFVVRTQDIEHPIYLAAYMSGADASRGGDTSYGAYGGRGDPEFVNVVPAGQYMNAYSFYADPTYAETSLVIVRAKTNGQFKDVWLECAGNLTGFRPIGARGDFEYVRVDLAREHGPGDTFGTSVCQSGLQRMRSDGPFTATLWGWDAYASYAYPGGMAQRKLVQTPLARIN
ncbi:MAG: hypothetical protein K0S65_1117 [Labilithrix sp.]|nr:hypothetical protein [Labilithrix sp.]